MNNIKDIKINDKVTFSGINMSTDGNVYFNKPISRNKRLKNEYLGRKSGAVFVVKQEAGK